jgi:hypothetical protein
MALPTTEHRKYVESFLADLGVSAGQVFVGFVMALRDTELSDEAKDEITYNAGKYVAKVARQNDERSEA